MDDLKRHNMFIIGASVCATIVILDAAKAWLPRWSDDVKIAIAVVGVALFLWGKRLREREAPGSLLRIVPPDKPDLANDD